MEVCVREYVCESNCTIYDDIWIVRVSFDILTEKDRTCLIKNTLALLTQPPKAEVTLLAQTRLFYYYKLLFYSSILL